MIRYNSCQLYGDWLTWLTFSKAAGLEENEGEVNQEEEIEGNNSAIYCIWFLDFSICVSVTTMQVNAESSVIPGLYNEVLQLVYSSPLYSTQSTVNALYRRISDGVIVYILPHNLA